MDLFNKLIKEGILVGSGLDTDFNSFRIYNFQNKSFKLTLTKAELKDL